MFLDFAIFARKKPNPLVEVSGLPIKPNEEGEENGEWFKTSNCANYLIGHQERKTDFIDFLTNRHKSNHLDILTQNLYCLSQVDHVISS